MRRRRRPTFYRELITPVALLFAGALVVAIAGVAIAVPQLNSAGAIVLYIVLLLGADVVILLVFGWALIRRRLLNPIERMIAGAEAVAKGELERRLPAGETAETARLAGAVNRMADRLIMHQARLAENVKSLEKTNLELTEARDELVRAEKLSSTGRLAAGIAHEVGNPLGAVMGYLDVLGRGAADEERELVDAARNETRRIDRIIRGLLDYARPRETRAELLSTGEIVLRTVELVSTQGRMRDVQVATELKEAEALPAVAGDEHQMQQVLVNLLLNAVDALEDTDDAKLVIRTERVEYSGPAAATARRADDPPEVDYSHRRRFHQVAPLPRAEAFARGQEVLSITVSDNGPGVPDALMDQIFEPFVTTKEPGKGTGLGLAVAARLVDAMGGTIRVDRSEEYGGAEFTILLPAADVDEAKVAALSSHTDASLARADSTDDSNTLTNRGSYDQ